ncbi:MAG: single-stranded DNA-binding protein [Methylomicrobium sp.]|nr:single-stranded DNA-binding protein [Methylomicrobium sp.]
MNKCQFHGYLGADPELKYLPDGAPVVNFSVGVSQRWKDKQTGEIKENTDWPRCVAFGRRAEVISEHFSKGSEILITDSQFKNRSYDKDGERRYITEFVVSGFEFCGKRRETGQGKANTQAQTYQSSMPPEHADFDDDIPF